MNNIHTQDLTKRKHILSPSILSASFIFFVVVLITIFFGRSLKPGGARMFITHDTSQPIRVEQFSLNLLAGKIPPKIAPELSFRMGWPLFSYYAPTAYWITSVVHLIGGLSIIDSLKMSYFLAIIVGFVSAYIFFKTIFPNSSALLGGVLYMSSTYLSIDIFVRGALAETWFIALLPLGFWCVRVVGNREILHTITRLSTILIISIFLGTHNSLSVICLGILCIYALMQRYRVRVLIMLGLGLLIASSYWIPALVEGNYSHVVSLSLLTKFHDHFLCWWQLWESKWGYGNSLFGCDDGMSFKVGKPQLLVFSLGLILLIPTAIWKVHKKQVIKSIELFFMPSLSLLVLFLTTYQSKLIWDMFPQITKILQFPWRLIGISLIGIGYVGAWLSSEILKLFRHSTTRAASVVTIIALSLLLYQSRTFINDQNTMSVAAYYEQYLSTHAKLTNLSYAYNELIPSSADVDTYQSFQPYNHPRLLPPFFHERTLDPIDGLDTAREVTISVNDPFMRIIKFIPTKTVIYANIHAFPNWYISINGKKRSSVEYINSHSVDKMGRPIILVEPGKLYEIKIEYHQSPIEIIANGISLITVIICLLFLGVPTLRNFMQQLSRRLNLTP